MSILKFSLVVRGVSASVLLLAISTLSVVNESSAGVGSDMDAFLRESSEDILNGNCHGAAKSFAANCASENVQAIGRAYAEARTQTPIYDSSKRWVYFDLRDRGLPRLLEVLVLEQGADGNWRLEHTRTWDAHRRVVGETSITQPGHFITSGPSTVAPSAAGALRSQANDLTPAVVGAAHCVKLVRDPDGRDNSWMYVNTCSEPIIMKSASCRKKLFDCDALATTGWHWRGGGQMTSFLQPPGKPDSGFRYWNDTQGRHYEYSVFESKDTGIVIDEDVKFDWVACYARSPKLLRLSDESTTISSFDAGSTALGEAAKGDPCYDFLMTLQTEARSRHDQRVAAAGGKNGISMNVSGDDPRHEAYQYPGIRKVVTDLYPGKVRAATGGN